MRAWRRVLRAPEVVVYECISRRPGQSGVKLMETVVGSPSAQPAGSPAASEHLLRRDVRLLCWELARMVREHGTGELLDLSEVLLRLAQRRREGDPAGRGGDGAAAGRAWISSQLQQLVRMEGCYLELMNLAEDRHRARVLRQRDDAAFPAPRGESIGAAVDASAGRGLVAAADAGTAGSARTSAPSSRPTPRRPSA